VTLKLALSRSRPPIPYGANLLSLFYVVVYFVMNACLFFVVFDLFFQYLAKRLAGKNVFEMTYFVSGGM